MRLSSASIFNNSLSALLDQQAKRSDIGMQMATGRRVVTAADDPSAASQALTTRQAMSTTEQHASSRTTAERNLSLEETVLDNVTTSIQSAQNLIVQAGNGSLSDADRNSIATQLESVYQQLVGLSNSTDGNGNYIFAGAQSGTKPFEVDGTGRVSYQGDSNQQSIKVDASRQMKSFDTGDKIFGSVTASSKYITQETAGNTGTASFAGPTVSDSNNAEYGDSFQINFTDDGAGNLSYTVTNTTQSTTSAAQPYTEGDSLTFGGLKLELDGTPADGDGFSVARGRSEDNNFINAIKNAVDALNTEQSTGRAKASLENALSATSRQLSNGLDNVLTVRSTVGSRLNEIDVLNAVGDDRALAYEDRLSSLVDLDYAKAISDFSLKQVALEAAQKTFSQTQQMSLFDLI
ncbi:flagellar hook-associated protein FlgL [Larsenimonas suaedae]|uniref:Flagellar hook-associated protein FlgL n=1 Tax=Larsenimonas suaedae TaxID=1851019 RepID=A0ABU1GT23_9GAMM|nr:flagellar hook-associated protein FlgL [Larsenimonas suaedae]MCM2971617.1 flagellar hook-associated protein FlgL [Larsenimonas suaedae]MDR5895169.1 flagellar hook-associated protein FlgL [Larsenimonas suaedae]